MRVTEMIRWQYSNSQSLTIPNTSVSLWLQGLVIFVIALFIRSSFLDWPLRFDEFYHILAARSWAIDGSFTILEGEYTRVPLFTALVGWLFSTFGESIEIARLPSLLAGSLNVLLIYLFVNRYVGITAALIAALFFIFDPVAISLSTQVRFYALQGLLFWIAAILVFYGTHHSICLHHRLRIALIIFPVLMLAAYLQPITLIGGVGFAVWIIIEHRTVIVDLFRRFVLTHPAWSALIGLTLFTVLLLTKNSISDIWVMYRHAPGWLMEYKDNPLFYPYQLIKQYPIFWSFFPVAAMFAIKSNKRIVVFCSVMFITLLLLHSFAGSKYPRYFNYALPFFFIIWGIFLADVFQTFRDLVTQNMPKRLGEHRKISGNVVAITLFAYAILSLSAATYYQRTKYLQTLEASKGKWISAEPLLKQLANQVDIVMVTDNNRAIYHIGRYDYAISPSVVRETETGKEFGRDSRDGGHIIGTAQSIEKILDCTKSGIFVSSERKWRNATFGIDNEGADILLERTQIVQTPSEWDLIIRFWRSPNRNDTPECNDIPRR